MQGIKRSLVSSKFKTQKGKFQQILRPMDTFQGVSILCSSSLWRPQVKSHQLRHQGNLFSVCDIPETYQLAFISSCLCPLQTKLVVCLLVEPSQKPCGLPWISWVLVSLEIGSFINFSWITPSLFLASVAMVKQIHRSYT